MPENLHEIQWTDDKIGDFWNNMDYLIMKDIHVNDYFALMGGKDLMRVVDKYLHFDNKVVMDYGCGMGILTEEILKKYKPSEVWACDTASDSVSHTKEVCGKYSAFKSAYVIDENQLPFEDGKFDIIFVTEIVEHLSDQALDFLLKQVSRLLRMGGSLIVTTPNEENLKKDIVVCPDCGCYYHRTQHVRSWSDKTLKEYVNRYGFNEKKTIKMTLYERNSFKRKVIAGAYNMLMPLLGRKPKNLIYVAEKTK